MVKVLAHAHRRRVLESGEYASIAEFAAVENINQYYVCRILRLTLLSRRIVEMILGAQQPSGRLTTTRAICESRRASGSL